MIFNIALRELRSMFLSPLAWVLLAVTQLILAWVFFSSIDVFFNIQSKLATIPNAPGATDLIISPLLQTASVVLLMITPLLTMRLISEEQRSHTMTLLTSSPLSITEIVLGKYLGMVLFMLVFIFMISWMPLSLYLGTHPDTGKTLSGLLGLFLLLSALCSAGIFMSSLTDNPVIAAISTFGLLLLLWIINNNTSSQSVTVFQYLSLTSHFSSLQRGILRSADIAYYFLFIIFFLVLTIRQMETRRLHN